MLESKRVVCAIPVRRIWKGLGRSSIWDEPQRRAGIRVGDSQRKQGRDNLDRASRKVSKKKIFKTFQRRNWSLSWWENSLFKNVPLIFSSFTSPFTSCFLEDPLSFPAPWWSSAALQVGRLRPARLGSCSTAHEQWRRNFSSSHSLWGVSAVVPDWALRGTSPLFHLPSLFGESTTRQVHEDEDSKKLSWWGPGKKTITQLSRTRCLS